MIIKSLRSLPLWCVVVFLACGQSPQKNNPLLRTDSLNLRSYELKSRDYLLSYPDSAVYFADRGLKLARQLHNLPAEGILLDRMAAINAAYGNIHLAIGYQQEAQKLFLQLKDQRQINASLSGLGILKAREGQIPEGTRLVNAARVAYQQQKDVPGLIKTYTRLGEIRELAHDLPGALSYYEKAEVLHKGQPLSDEYFELISSMGKVHTQLGDHTKAAGYYERGAGSSLNSAFIKAHIQLLNNAGKAYNSLGNKSKALGFHRQGLQQARQNHLPEEEARSLMGIASVMKNGDADQSIRHLKNALEIAKKIGHKQLSAEIYHSLSDIYRQQSRYQEALSTLSAHHRLLDSLLQANEGHRIAVLQGSYELAESKLHIEDLKLTNEKHIYQRNEGVIVAGAILLLLIIIYLNFRRTRRLNAELTASNLTKDKLFSIIGHDLRNPIGGITQLLAMMEEGNYTSEEAHDLIVEMRKQGNVTMEILNALLNWGEAQLKGIHVKPLNFNPKESINKNMLVLQQQAADKGVTILDSTSHDLLLHGDQNHFEFMIRNLLSNAIKFSHPGGNVNIAATLQPETRQVVFSVQDFGKGISPEQQALFYHSNLDIAYGTKGEKGTGIGLMLSKEFIKANQGKLWLESKLGKGSTFYFSFPLPTKA